MLLRARLDAYKESPGPDVVLQRLEDALDLGSIHPACRIDEALLRGAARRLGLGAGEEGGHVHVLFARAPIFPSARPRAYA